MNGKSDYLSQVDVLQGMSEAELNDVSDQTRFTVYASDHIFFMPDDPGEVLFILKRGRVQLYRISPDGRKLVVAILNPGAMFGHMALIGQRLHNTYAQAIDEVTICVWNREQVEAKLLTNPEFAIRVLNAVGERLIQVEERLAESTFKRLPAQLASLLLRLVDENKSGDLSGYTHQHLADMLGTYRETVTQILNEWKNQDIITLSRKRIRVNDCAALNVIANAE